ncbi:enoyl-CoA hydratase/isomerase family protein [Intrasporangium sp.]|uniref:enoyl-CoA hydratase/isomerase family protein n=1 Tax=Intrasporangium sp. TaxID=1925024 RepID=UPI002939A20C|nr:enoyl-CoA hydratase-related protein [Intrasporangium sp.]MDV3221416.1 enoyl-CoA hydratase-related protein [Intrasporangium sp.]
MSEPQPETRTSAGQTDPTPADGTPTDATPTDTVPVVVTASDGVAWIRLNRPDAMNALNRELKVALLGALRSAADDPAVRCVVLTGNGRAFCVGQDLKEHVADLASGETTLATTVTEHYNPIVMLLATMNKPVVAALNGVAAGAGLSFALACDVRVMVEGAGLNTAFAGIALSCDSGASWSLPRFVGPARAKNLLMFPRTVGADEALSLGLVSKVVPPEELDAVVTEQATSLAAGPTLAYGAIRRAVASSAGSDLATALAHEAELMALTGRSADHQAAVDAFLAKEKPTFEGR